METDKPLISILMAVYEPRLDWLKEQLDSLNAQTYPNLKLYIRDDCSPTVSFEATKKLVSESITAFPYIIGRNSENRGSNTTFELLTKEADGKYFAYCDQDDIWLPEKLSILQQTIEAENASFVCSDMYVIDENGKQIADSITKVRKHHVFQEGADLADKLLIRNFASGCTVLIRADTAKAAIPFCPYMVHDHYLALYAAVNGTIITVHQPLISYRVHGGNQTSVLAGVTDRESYYRIRLEELEKRLDWLQIRFADDHNLSREIQDAQFWIAAREKWFSGDVSQKGTIWKYSRFSKAASLFELTTARMPESLFRLAAKLIQKGIL